MALADQLAGIQWTAEIADNCLIADALILCRYTDMETGETGVFVSKTPAADTVTVLGLLEAGRQIESGEWLTVAYDDETDE